MSPEPPLPPGTFCTATTDGDSLVVVNLAGLTHPEQVKERILAKLHVPDDRFYACRFHLTRIGQGQGTPVSDRQLWDVCRDNPTIFVKQQPHHDRDAPGPSAAQTKRSPVEYAHWEQLPPRRPTTPTASRRQDHPWPDSRPGPNLVQPPPPQHRPESRGHPQYGMAPPTSQYHNLYIQSQYQSRPASAHSPSHSPSLSQHSAFSSPQQQPPRATTYPSKSVDNLRSLYVQDSRPPPIPGPVPTQYRAGPPPSTRPPPSLYPQQQQLPRQPSYQQVSPHLQPAYLPPPGQTYAAFDPRVMRPPPSQIRTTPVQGYAPYPAIQQRPANSPQPSLFRPVQPPATRRASNQSSHPYDAYPQPRSSHELTGGHISLRPGETLQHVVRRQSEGQHEPISTTRPPVAAHMRAADPSQKRTLAGAVVGFEAEPGRYASESVPLRRESPDHKAVDAGRARESVPKRRSEGPPRSAESERPPLSASARSSTSSFASSSSSSSGSVPRRRSDPYGGLTDDSASHRTSTSTRSSNTSATGPLTPLTPSVDQLVPILPLPKSAGPLMGPDELHPAKDAFVDTFDEDEEETGTWQPGRTPMSTSFDEDEPDAGTWLVSPNQPATPLTAVPSREDDDDDATRSPQRKEQRPNLRLTIDTPHSSVSESALSAKSSPAPRSGAKLAGSDAVPSVKASSPRRVDRVRSSPAGIVRNNLATLLDRSPPVVQRASFLGRDSDSDWGFRPPIETVLENLDEYFPEHDLDQPIVDAATPPTATVSPVTSPARNDALSVARQATAALKYKKSIRKVAQDRKRNLQIQKLGAGVEAIELEPESHLLRRKSTKLWGNRVEEVTPEQAKLMSTAVVERVADDDPDNCTYSLAEVGSTDLRTVSFKWVKGELIGRGTYGQVYLALNVTTGDMLAVKQVELPKTRSDKDDARQQGMVSSLKAEIELLKDLDHAKIVQYLGTSARGLGRR